jgi:secretion/DNA translocation related TadE-like protein
LNRAADERGAATVLAAVMVAALVAVTLVGVKVGSVVVARHRAQTAADLAVLAAGRRQTWRGRCERWSNRALSSGSTSR